MQFNRKDHLMDPANGELPALYRGDKVLKTSRRHGSRCCKVRPQQLLPQWLVFACSVAYEAHDRTLTLNVFRVNDESMRRFLLDKSVALYFLDLILRTQSQTKIVCLFLLHRHTRHVLPVVTLPLPAVR